jgi:hypothetical protein
MMTASEGDDTTDVPFNREAKDADDRFSAGDAGAKVG